MKRFFALLLTGLFFLCGCSGNVQEVQSITGSESSAPVSEPSKDQTSESFEAEYERDTQWCNRLWNTAAEKLCASGTVQKSDELFRFFAFLPNGQIRFDSEEVREQLTAPDFTLTGKVIVACLDENNPDNAPALVLRDNTDPRVTPPPYGLPSSHHIPPESFAKSREACDYLILYGGLFSDYEKNYYIGAHRITVSTLVFVIDTKTEEFVHIEYIGTDRPGSSTKAPKGKTYIDEALNYLTKLLGAESGEASAAASSLLSSQESFS